MVGILVGGEVPIGLQRLASRRLSFVAAPDVLPSDWPDLIHHVLLATLEVPRMYNDIEDGMLITVASLYSALF